MNRKFAMALNTASVIPITRPQVRPASTAQPANTTTIPRIRWIHPQVDALNWKRYSRVARKKLLLTIAISPSRAWNTPAMIIMKPANKMKPTAQPLGSSLTADGYGDAWSAIVDPPLLGSRAPARPRRPTRDALVARPSHR